MPRTPFITKSRSGDRTSSRGSHQLDAREFPVKTRRRRIALVDNLCTHYRLPLFQRLAESSDIDFYFTSDGGESWWSRHHRIEAVGLNRPRARTRLELLWRLSRGQYDCYIVALVGRSALIAALMAVALTRRPFVLWVGIWEHPSTLLHRLTRMPTRLLYRRADAVLVYGSHTAAYIAGESGRTQRVFEARQCVDNQHFRSLPEASSLAAMRSQVPPDVDLVALFVGRLEPEKGVHTLLVAAAHARARIGVAVIGSGEQASDLASLARELDIADRTRFVGYVDQRDLSAWFRVADVLVVPSLTTAAFREPWALVANEAMNASIPVIATDAVGAAAGGLVIDGSTGLIVPEGDTRQLARALDLLAADRDLRQRLGASASSHVADWSYEVAASAFAAAVEAAISARG
jgi:glycosyltransferase involved in cell wall biosynthesis